MLRYDKVMRVEISQLLLWTKGSRCSSPPQGELGGLEHLVNTSDKLLSTQVFKKENLLSFHTIKLVDIIWSFACHSAKPPY